MSSKPNSSKPTTQPGSSADLAWCAFQYVAGELGHEETAAFEQRLSEDQTAREAVAQAVELSESLAQAYRHPLSVVANHRSSSWLRQLTWMSIGAAACLLAMITWSQTGRPASVATAFPAGEDTSALALVWAHASEELRSLDGEIVADQLAGNDKPNHDLPDQDLMDPEGNAPRAGDTDSPPGPADGDEGRPFEAPSWMVTAVEGLCGELAQPHQRPVE